MIHESPLIRMIRKKLERRRAVKQFKKELWQRVERERGFGWAFDSYYAGELSLSQIEGYIESAREFGAYDSFDKGAEDALEQLRQIGVSELCPKYWRPYLETQ